MYPHARVGRVTLTLVSVALLMAILTPVAVATAPTGTLTVIDSATGVETAFARSCRTASGCAATVPGTRRNCSG